MIRETSEGVLLSVYVKPGSEQFKLIKSDEKIILYAENRPIKNKVNKEILNGLKKLVGKDIEIVKGLKDKKKLILIKGAKLEDIEKLVKE